MSLFGALPFFISGDIPNYVDAFFETVSGFTTTGTTILTGIESLSIASIFWRSFTHWVGGMPLYDSLIHTFGTAGTGGSSLYAKNIPQYNSLYFLVLLKNFKAVFKDLELRAYASIVLFAALPAALRLSLPFPNSYSLL